MPQETPPVVTRRKLIEVALPLDAINKASVAERDKRHGHPSMLHLWWARRPLAAARAVLFAQLVDDPSSLPELSEEEQDEERRRLFGIVEEMVKWENTTNEQVLEAAREEIRASWRRTCVDNRNHPQAGELFNPERLPAFHDPFAGGGSIPLEAQRLGLEALASDLNPVAVLISKAAIEIPSLFAGKPPVNPDSSRGPAAIDVAWKGTAGLTEDVRYYGKWMRDEAERRIGHLYPKAKVTEEMAQERPDLKPYVGEHLTVIAWLWVRTVKSANPAFADVDVPLASSFILSKTSGREAYVQPVLKDRGYYFTVKSGKPPESAAQGTKLGGAGNFRCLVSGVPLPGDYIKSEGTAGRMGSRLMAVVAEGHRGRVFLPPTLEHERPSFRARPGEWRPEGDVPPRLTGGTCVPYGLDKWWKLFTDRQLVALTTLAELVDEARDRVQADAVRAGLPGGDIPLRDGGRDAVAYAEAVAVYLGLLLDQVANHSSSLCGWNNTNAQMRSVFARPAIPMVWDFAESNPFSSSSGSYFNLYERQIKGLSSLLGDSSGRALQADAHTQSLSLEKIISTDPPYYNNMMYADMSDFFYVWARKTIGRTFPELFSTIEVPKYGEVVAARHRHENKAEAETFFLERMSEILGSLAESAHPAFPITIYYAFKQSEVSKGLSLSSTGWETFLDAVISSGLHIAGTWPIRTEKKGRVISINTNALASSIVLACRPRLPDAPATTRREFVDALNAELPQALAQIQAGNIAPVDLAQAAIGPGMAVFTRYSRVLDASGEPVSVREALSLINQTLDETLAEQEGDFDADTRWALAWFEQSGFAEGDFGVAETLSKAKNTSVEGMVDAGILVSEAGKVRLLRPDELADDWDPQTERRLTVWESVHHLARVLERGEEPASEVVARLGVMAEPARELAYRLYRICDQKNRPQEALAYNALIQSWPELANLARQQAPVQQGVLLGGSE